MPRGADAGPPTRAAASAPAALQSARERVPPETCTSCRTRSRYPRRRRLRSRSPSPHRRFSDAEAAASLVVAGGRRSCVARDRAARSYDGWNFMTIGQAARRRAQNAATTTRVFGSGEWPSHPRRSRSQSRASPWPWHNGTPRPHHVRRRAARGRNTRAIQSARAVRRIAPAPRRARHRPAGARR